jgi:hypothetical protein
MTYRQNPVRWVDEMLEASRRKLERSVPPEWMPSGDELGCGSFGCVYPTHDPNIVVKFTTDDTEFEFARDLSAKMQSGAVVRYHKALRMPVMQPLSGKPVFALWRDAADHVGHMMSWISRQYGDQLAERSHSAMKAQSQASWFAWAKLQKLRRPDPEEAKRIIRPAMAAWHQVGQVPVAELQDLAQAVAGALTWDRVFFADIRSPNLGQVGARWVITDPGHVVVIAR